MKYHVPTIILFLSGVFRRETASGFYPWSKVDSPRKRVAEGLCGWWHGNSFPMTQSAQSLRQMRSISHCSKAVFYVFVFDSIHNSATMHNLSPSNFPLNRCFFVVWVLCFLWRGGGIIKKQFPRGWETAFAI